MNEKKKVTKECISCNQKGHTYLECTKHPFYDMVCDAFGIPKLLVNVKPKLLKREEV